MIGNQEAEGAFSLYFHIPFCNKKCPYCHFFVLPNKEDLKKIYLEALHLEMQRVLPRVSNRNLVSIYFGGGTPFLIGPSAILGILQNIKRCGFTIPSSCEITLEMNPEDSDPLLLQEYINAGVNRLSIGFQSLDDSELVTLGRSHSSNQSLKCVEEAYSSGFRNISIDLMYDLPSQTQKSWKRTVERLDSLPITHLSLYNLTIEPHTGFYKRRKELEKTRPKEEESLQLLTYAVDKLQSMSLKRYEISAFAKPGYHSIHNTGYWLGREFIGLGPSAFSYKDKRRYQNVCNLNAYGETLKKGDLPVDFSEELPYPESLYELLAVQIRLLEGVDLNRFQKRHGALPRECFERLESLQRQGLITLRESHVQLSEKGLLFYDTVASEII